MRLQERYKKEIAPKLKEKFGFKNIFEIPRYEKVVLNIGFGRHQKDKELIKYIEKNLTAIAGQKVVLTKAKKSISAFKVREGTIIGAKATLRGARMYDFIEKLVNLAFPRVRDFRGISNKIIDKKGNISIGIKEHTAFGEIKPEEVEILHGLEVCISTSAKNRDEGLALFELTGFPFKKD